MAEPMMPRPMTPMVCGFASVIRWAAREARRGVFALLPKNQPPARLRLASPLHRGATDKALHFFFFAVFFFGADFFLAEENGLASTSTTATMHGSVPRTLQEWLVPRWMKTSPGLSRVSPLSRMA